jgi:hypothetical protein
VGIENPIYDILDILKQDAAKSQELQRCLEKAITEMIDRFNVQNKADFKQSLQTAIAGNLRVKIYKVQRSYYDKVQHYNYDLIDKARHFYTQSDCTAYIWHTICRFGGVVDCTQDKVSAFVQSPPPATLMVHIHKENLRRGSSWDETYKVDIMYEHVVRPYN